METGDDHIHRVRRICMSLPGTTEKLSHGEPTFFVRKRVYAMFANNHHGDGHVAVWLPAAPGMQEMLIKQDAKTYFRPPYVGVNGWVGVELRCVDNEQLTAHLLDAWGITSTKGTATSGRSSRTDRPTSSRPPRRRRG